MQIEYWGSLVGREHRRVLTFEQAGQYCRLLTIDVFVLQAIYEVFTIRVDTVELTLIDAIIFTNALYASKFSRRLAIDLVSRGLGKNLTTCDHGSWHYSLFTHFSFVVFMVYVRGAHAQRYPFHFKDVLSGHALLLHTL